MFDKSINSMTELAQFTIHRLYQYQDIDELDTRAELSASEIDRIAETMWLALRQFKTNQQVTAHFIADYQTVPICLTSRGYRLSKPLPHYIQIDTVDDFDYDPDSIRLVDFLIDNPPYHISDCFLDTHQHNLPHTLTARLKDQFQTVIIPVPFDQIPKLTEADRIAIESASYHTEINDQNWSIRLAVHVQAVLNHSMVNQNDIINLSLLTAGYIAQHHNIYTGVNCGNDDEYSPVRSIGSDLIFSSAKAWQWPNRWFTIKHRYHRYQVHNDSIEDWLNTYQHQSGHYDREFKAYDRVIKAYSHIDSEKLADFIKTEYQHGKHHNHQMAFDWDDLRYVDLPDINIDIDQ